MPQPSPASYAYRTGFGYDAHRLVEGRPLVLGGVRIPFEKGLEGHSDADVLLHALIDAMLGAAGMGDIGTYFPSSDPAIEGISSMQMLSRVVEMLRKEGWRVENVDGTVVAQQPRLSPHVPHIKEAIASALGIEPDRVNVKGKTTDGLGFVGAGEGMEAYCAVMLARAVGEQEDV
jgi:2-C-methyl-D-erythritol 2,4-cyclodiphosphate synthase